MNSKGVKILADENIHPDVIKFLSEKGFDVVSVFDYRLQGKAV